MAGLISGIMAGVFYNRFSEIKLPDYLAFFAGKRFVPIISGFTALFLAMLFGYGWPLLEQGMNGQMIALYDNGHHIPLLWTHLIPASLEGRALHNVQNAMFRTRRSERIRRLRQLAKAQILAPAR